MGWRERDWAKWTDEERADYLGVSTSATAATPRMRRTASVAARGRTEVTLLAMMVSLVASLTVWHFHLYQPLVGGPVLQRPQPLPAQVSRATIVYGTGLAYMNGSSQEMTCTAMATNTAAGSSGGSTAAGIQLRIRRSGPADRPLGLYCDSDRSLSGPAVCARGRPSCVSSTSRYRVTTSTL